MNNLARNQVSPKSLHFKLECYGATRTQEGKSANEDAFLIERHNIPFAALSDGAGNAEQVAKRVLRFFQRLFNEASIAEVFNDETWSK